MAKTATTTERSKAEEILEVGQELMQTRGYDGFSYRDIADLVGIKSASVHYYFPAKSDLALAVTQRYRASFNASVLELDGQHLDPVDRLHGFAEIFQHTLEKLNRVCLCGMLASETTSVSEAVSAETRDFFSEQQSWIQATITEGIEHGSITTTTEPVEFARTLLSALEGAMIMARSMEQPEHLAKVAEQLISLLRVDTVDS